MLYHIAVKNIVHNFAYVFKNIAVFDELLVIACGGSYIKGISPAAVPFGINPVKSKSNLGIDIGTQGVFRPGGINFAGSDVFYVFRKRNCHVFRIGIRRAKVYRYKFRHINISFNHFASPLRKDFPALEQDLF